MTNATPGPDTTHALGHDAGPARTPDRTDERDGFRLNRGPHAVFDGGEGRAVLARLGIALDGAHPPTKGALGREDRVDPLPQGIGAVTSPFLGPVDKARLLAAVARINRLDPASVAHLTIDEWLEQTLPERPREILRTLVRIGTYTVDSDLVSADVAVHQVQAAAPGVTYLHGGWRQLTDGLRAAAPGVTRLAGSAHGVAADPDGPFVVTDHGTVRGGRVVVAAGSPEAVAALLANGAPASWSVLGPAARASCLDLGLRRLPEIPSWFGVDRPHYLVAHAPNAHLAPEGMALVHAMRNLHHDETTSPDELRADLHALARRAGIADDDVVLERYLHHMVVVSALVTPAGGGLAGRPDVHDTGVDGVLVAGDWVGPTGWLADCSLASGEAAGAAAAREATTAHARVGADR